MRTGLFLSTTTNGSLVKNTKKGQQKPSDERDSGHDDSLSSTIIVGSDLLMPADRVLPSKRLTVEALYKRAVLAPIDLTFHHVRQDPNEVNLRQAARVAARGAIKAYASVLFVVKRPGCFLCHEQGDDLRKLVAEFPPNAVAPWAAIKEINVDNQGLLDLYENYFPFPFYKDEKLSLYKALGEKRVNLLTAFSRIAKAKRRWKRKGLPGGDVIGKGEGMILGGVMVFNRRGDLKYAVQERFGLELPLDEIRQAVQVVLDEARNHKREGGDRSSCGSVHS